MNKTALKIFLCFTAISVAVVTILLIINFLAFALVGSDESVGKNGVYPQKILKEVSETLHPTEKGFEIEDQSILPADYWCILINGRGDVIWSLNMPEDIPEHYTLNDIARMTRWFLNDYPVYVRTEENGLLVLGLPKDAVGKYDISYSMEWFDTLPRRLSVILFLNLFLAAVLAFLFGLFLYKHIVALSQGLYDLQREKSVKRREKGIFKELIKRINDTSAAIERKNAVLAVRDRARSNWISGISHDIRTPLAMVMGNAEALESDGELSEENRKKAGVIMAQSMKMKKLIEDLNLISSLEYDMQPSQRNPLLLCSFIREVVSNILNSGMAEKAEISLDLRDEKATVFADKSLLERAVFNLIHNSIVHNEEGCKIRITVYTEDDTAHMILADNGCGVPDSIIEKMAEVPKSAHGLGLPMAYKIISVHGGQMTARNENGFIVEIELPL